MPTSSRCFSKSGAILAQPAVIGGHAGDEHLEVDTDDRTLNSDAVVTLPRQRE
jgi:hypothetical protein